MHCSLHLHNTRVVHSVYTYLMHVDVQTLTRSYTQLI